MRFVDDGVWVLPSEGTLGNKAYNLYSNTATILANGFLVPRSLVVPFEYIAGRGIKDIEGLDAMNSAPVSKVWVDKGSVAEPFAASLSRLSGSLPYAEGMGWEVEFVKNKKGTYVVQVSRVRKSGKIDVPENLDNLFDAIAVVGTGIVVASSVLYMPYNPFRVSDERAAEEILVFEGANPDYCLATVHSNVTTASNDSVLRYLSPAAVLDIASGFWLGYPFSPHVEQFMRQGRVALAGTFNRELGMVLLSEYQVGKKACMYSPTKLYIVSDEALDDYGRPSAAIVALADGKVSPFHRLGSEKGSFQ